VTLFKLADALATAMTTTFVLKIGFSRIELATIIKGVGFAAALLGGLPAASSPVRSPSAPASGSAACCRRSPFWHSPGRPSSVPTPDGLPLPSPPKTSPARWAL